MELIKVVMCTLYSFPTSPSLWSFRVDHPELIGSINTRAFMGSYELDMSRIYWDDIVTKRKMRSWKDLLEGR